MTARTETEEPQAPDTETPEADEESSRIVSLDALHAKIDDLAAKITGLGKAKAPAGRPSKADDAEDVRQQVRDEVGKLKAADDADRKRRGEIDSLRDQVKKLAEKAPVEYRKITRWMWGDDEK
jgi:hypothetical protein